MSTIKIAFKKGFSAYIVLVIISLNAIAQSPGGVAGAAAWYKGDAGLSSLQWNDQSANAYHLTGANSPVVSNFINFNPVATFNGTNQNFSSVATAKANWPVGNSAFTYYYVARLTNTSATGSNSAIGIGADGTGFHSGRELSARNIASGTNPYNSVTNGVRVSTSSPTWDTHPLNLIRSGHNAANPAPFYIAANGGAEQAGTNQSPTYTNTNAFRVGVAGTSTYEWQGDVAEVIVYGGKHAATDYDKVESYLALKYGITKAGNYISSTGTVLWNATSNAGYLNNIAGIGNDLASGLHQKQSVSQNATQRLIISSTGAANSNALNTTGFSDGQFLVWGDNGGTQAPALNFWGISGVDTRFGTIWKTQVSNNIGTVRILWPAGQTNLHLITSVDEVFTATDNITPMTGTQTINGVSYNYTDITFNNTTGYYFTFLSQQAFPGGVDPQSTENFVWYKADAINGATENTSITSWLNSGTKLSYDLTGVTGARVKPLYYGETAAQLVNFNPVLRFSGNHNIHNLNRLASSASPFTFMGVNVDENSSNDFRVIFAASSNIYDFSLNKYNSRYASYRSGTYYLTQGANALNGAGGNVFSPAGAANAFYNGTTWVENTSPTQRIQPQVFGISSLNATNSSPLTGYIDGYKTINTNPGGIQNNFLNAFSVGAYPTGIYEFTGRIPEVMMYGRQLTDDEAQYVNTYLALKYGTTLGQGSSSADNINRNVNNYDYKLIGENGVVSTIWNTSANAGYNFNIAGIGRNNKSALHQKQSSSVNTGMTQVLIATTGVANTNKLNLAGLNDGQYFVWGDNGLERSLYTPLANVSNVNYIMRAVWKAQNTNSVETVRVMWPAGIVNIKLMISSDAIFTSTDSIYNMYSNSQIINGVSYNYADVKIQNGYYFTFAGYACAPGGVVAGLKLWYDAALNASTSAWNARNTSFNLSRSGTGTLTLSPGNHTSNFNPYFAFPSGSVPSTEAYFTAPLPAIGELALANLGRLHTDFAVGSPSGSIFASGNNIVRFSNLASSDIHRYGVGINGGTYNPNLHYINSGGTINESNTNSLPLNNMAIIDAQVNSITSGNNKLVGFNGSYQSFSGDIINDMYSHFQIGGGSYGFYGNVPEVIYYNTVLNAQQTAKVNSYLAIKYGITLVQPANYVSSLDSVVWNAGLNAAFNNNIFGIARDFSSCFTQNISNSINQNAIATLSTTNDFTNVNNHASRIPMNLDQQFLMIGDNKIDTGVVAVNVAVCPLLTSDLKQLRKIWMVQRTNDTSSKYLQIDLSAYPITSNVQLMVASDAGLTTDVALIPAVSFIGGKAVFKVAFPKLAYFTVIGSEVPPSCTVCTTGTQVLQNGRIWGVGGVPATSSNTVLNTPLKGTAPQSGALSADVRIFDPGNVEFVPTYYPLWAGNRVLLVRNDNKAGNAGKMTYSVKLKDANGSVSAKASFQISGITEWVRTMASVTVVGYCGGSVIRPKLTHAYNRTPALNTALRSFTINSSTSTMTAFKHGGALTPWSSVNVNFEKPVDSITVEWTRTNHYPFKVLSYLYITDMTFVCSNVTEPTPDNVSLVTSYQNNDLPTCQEALLKLDFINNNCAAKTIDVNNMLPAGIEYVPDSYTGIDSETPSYSGQSFVLNSLLLPPGTSTAYIRVKASNPAVSGTYNSQFTFTVQGGLNSPNPYLSDDLSGQTGFQPVALTYTASTPPVMPTFTASAVNQLTNADSYLTNISLPGETIEYTYTFNNTSGAPISGLELTDQLSDSAHFVAGTITASAGVTFTANNYGAADEENLLNLQALTIPAGVSTIQLNAITRSSTDTIRSNAVLSYPGPGECGSSTVPLADSTQVVPLCYRDGLLVPINTSLPVALPSNCDDGGWKYYVNTDRKAVIAIRPNGTNWNPDEITIDATSFINKQVNGTLDSAVVMQRLYTIKHAGAISNPVDVRLYYSNSELTGQVPIAAYPLQTWFKHSGTKANIEAELTPTGLSGPAVTELTPDATGTEFGIDYVQFNGISSFSTFGYKGNTSRIVPVSLLSFTAKKNGSKAVLNWTTASEINNKGFEILHSRNGLQYEVAGWVNGNNNTSTLSNYQFVHADNGKGIHYYRLRQVDLSGQEKLSDIKLVDFGKDNSAVTISPNPTTENAIVDGVEDVASVSILDPTGKRLYSRKLNNESRIELKFNGYGKGVFLIVLHAKNGQVKTYKITVL